MSSARVLVWCVLVAELAGHAHADDACRDAVSDPTATPIRDAGLDAQRGACLRDELAASFTTHALIDTPGFHGVLGGDLSLAGRLRMGRRFELGARARLVDHAFVQNAVNKVTDTRFGPLVVGATYSDALSETSQIGLVVAAELPFTRDSMATIRTAGLVAAVASGSLSPRWTLHGRLGTVGEHTSSAGGTSSRIGLRAGIDLVLRARRTLALLAGTELQAGWYGGFDAALLRAGLAWRVRGSAWRVVVGAGIPRGGSDRTTAIVTAGVVREL